MYPHHFNDFTLSWNLTMRTYILHHFNDFTLSWNLTMRTYILHHFNDFTIMCRFVTNYLGTMVDRFFLFGFGFNWIHTRGQPAPPRDAPILVVSPHSCILDMFIVSLYRVPTFLARADIRRIPLFGCKCSIVYIYTSGSWAYLLIYANFGRFVC